MTSHERYQYLRALPVRSIAVWRPLKLGDFLAMIPALRALRAAFPEARVDYIGLPANQELFQRYSRYITGFVPFPGWPGLPEGPWEPKAILRFLADIQARHYDLLIQMHGDGIVTNPLVALCGACITAGFAGPMSFRPSNEWFTDYPGHDHEIIRLLKLCDHLGIPRQGTQMEFPLSKTDEQELSEIVRLPQEYICIHAGAISGRPWGARYFAAVADRCAGLGLAVMLTGTAAELPIVRRVLRHMRTPAINLTGKTRLGTLGALLRRARLYIGNDTGVAHLSVALGTPAVVIFTTADAVRWAPLDSRRYVALPATRATPELVFTRAKTLLSTRSPHGTAAQSLYLAHSR